MRIDRSKLRCILPFVIVVAMSPSPAAARAPTSVERSSPGPEVAQTAAQEPGLPLPESQQPDSKAQAERKRIIQLPPVRVTDSYHPPSKLTLSSDPATNPASVTVFDYPDEKKYSVRDYADLLKPVTGVSSNNFDQGGIGFGLTLRGFSQRSNGGSSAVFIDGVPVNQSSHTLTNGYADLTPLIPELVERFVLTRGPFDVRAGANALGGSLQVTTLDKATTGVALAAGSFDYQRASGIYAFNSENLSGYVSLVGSSTSGYRDNADVDLVNGFGKLVFAAPGGTASLRAQVFSDEFGAPGFLNRALVENGTLNPRTAVNPTDGGNVDMWNIAFNYRSDGYEPLTVNAYVVDTKLDRFSSRFTTNPFDPAGAGQALQVDDRLSVGGSVNKYFLRDLPRDMSIGWLVGIGVNSDDVQSERFETRRRTRTPATPGASAQTEDTDFTLTTTFGYTQVDFKPVSWLKLTGGVRYDRLKFDIEDRTRSLSVDAGLTVTQPKAGIVVSPFANVDIFANYGKGFLPPSAIGGQQLVRDPEADAAELDTRELGVQYTSADGRWYFLTNIYRTEFTNELQGQPAPNPPISLGPSERDGFDVEARLRMYENGGRRFSVFANYSEVDGKLVGRSAPGTRIPDIPEFMAKYGFQLQMPLPGGGSDHGISWSAAHLIEGPKSLEPTDRLHTKRFSRIDSNIAYVNKRRPGLMVFLGVVLYPDRRLEETVFLFGNTPGVSPKAPLTVQGGFRYQF